MGVLVAAETVVLILLALLVAGLLRSHAEILRQLAALNDGHGRPGSIDPSLPPARPAMDTAGAAAPDVGGTTLDGDPVKVTVAGGRADTLLAFLSSGCGSCQAFWDALQPGARTDIPGSPRVVVVTKDSAYESPSRLRELAPPDVPVVMSSAAWEAYAVQGSPYFIYVDGSTGVVAGEGTAGRWEQVLSLIRDAFSDAQVHAERTPSAGLAGNSPAERLRRADEELAAAGIGPGHPSLYGRDPSTRGLRKEADAGS